MNTDLTNPALSDLAFLVGAWDMTISRASFLSTPDETVSGRVAFEPIEGGMLLVMRQVGDAAGPPLASWVIGRDGPGSDHTVLYADSRGVSRVYAMCLRDDRWTIWRDDPDFAQRFEATVDADRRRIEGRWERRAADGPWEHDFAVAYTRP